MIRKLAATFVLLMGLMAVAGPAQAGEPASDYADCVIIAEPVDDNGNGLLDAGEDVEVSGAGLQPNITSDIVFDLGEPSEEVLGTAETDAAGSFGPVTVTIPADASDGPHTISVACDEDGENVNDTTVVVGEPAGPPGAPLPRTGSDVEPLVVVGGAALLAGAALVVVAKRRRDRTTPA